MTYIYLNLDRNRFSKVTRKRKENIDKMIEWRSAVRTCRLYRYLYSTEGRCLTVSIVGEKVLKVCK